MSKQPTVTTPGPAGATVTALGPAAQANPGPPPADLLIVDELMLLLVDDDGRTVQGAGTLFYTLGGAVLTELALLGRIRTDDPSILSGPVVTAVGGGPPLPDPLLQSAYDVVAAGPQRVQPLLVAIGAGLWRVVLARLVARGVLRHQESQLLGMLSGPRWPTVDPVHEAQLRVGIRRVLEDGEPPHPRTAAIVGLLSAGGSLRSLRPPLPWTPGSATRARELARGQWGPASLATAIDREAAAVVAASAAAINAVRARR